MRSNLFGINIFKREDPRNYNAFVNTYSITDVDFDEFCKELMIFFISLEYHEHFNYELINGISIIKKSDEKYDFKIWF